MPTIHLPDGSTTRIDGHPQPVMFLRVIDRKASRRLGHAVKKLQKFNIVERMGPGGFIEYTAEPIIAEERH